MACKNNGDVRNKNRNKQYRMFIWSYSCDSMDGLNEALKSYRNMAKTQG